MEKLVPITFAVLVSLSPVVEINGSIPLAIALGLNPIIAFLVTTLSNSLLFFPLYVFLDFFYEKFLSKIKLFKKYLNRSRKKAKPYLDKYGYLGLTLFIALPTPFTGVYTASFISWLFGMDVKKSFLAILIAVLFNGFLVLGVSLGFLSFLKYLI